MKDLCLRTKGIYDLISSENLRQIEKWGVQDHDAFQWLAFATEELGETSQAISEHNFRDGSAKNVVKEATQAATLCLKIAEMFLHEKEAMSDE